jgi:hypothetical protein
VCPCTLCPDSSHVPPNTNARLNTITLARGNFTTTAPIDEAIAYVALRDLGEQFTLKEVAENGALIAQR